MNGISEEQERLREYLLGDLRDGDLMRTFEERVLLDERFNDDVELAEDGLIEDFLDGELTNEESARFREFFLISSERRGKLRLAQKLRDYAARAPKPRTDAEPTDEWRWWKVFFTSPVFGIAAAAVLVVGAGIGIWRVSFYQSDADRGIAQLQLAYEGKRPTEARTSIGFGYLPASVTRGAAIETADARARSRAELYLLEAAQDASDAKAHHALGILYLADRKYTEALNELDIALRWLANDAALHNDIAATHFEKANAAFDAGADGNGLESLSQSLEAVEKALELNVGLTEALFNRALILQKMRLKRQAIEAWEVYLQNDPSSPWANEARENLDLLRTQSGGARTKEQILDDFLAAYESGDDARAWRVASQTKELVTGSMVHGQLIERILVSRKDDDHLSADKYSNALVHLGVLEKRYAGDIFFSEHANYYSRVTTDRQDLLNDAQDRMRAGYEFLVRAQWSDGIEAFEQAKRLYKAAGNRWEANIAEYQLCYCLYQLDNRILEANGRLLALSKSLDASGSLWLKTIVDAAVASTFTLRADHSQAIIYNQRSLTTATAISDSYSIQKAHNQLTHEYWLLGRTDKALESIYQTLSQDDLYFQSGRQKSRNLIFATEGLYRLKHYDAASMFAREQAYVAENETPDPWFAHTAHINLALVSREKGNARDALSEIDEALEIAGSFPDAGMRGRQLAKTRLILGHVQRKNGDCNSAIGNYTSVIDHYTGMQFFLHVYEARKARLACLIALRTSPNVESETAAVIEIFEKNRGAITREADRTIFFDREQNVYDLAADYAYSTLNDPAQAFRYMENSRARSLLSATSPESAPLTLDETRDAIPAGLQMLYYAVFFDKVVVWYISDSQVRAAAANVDSSELRKMIDLHRRTIVEKNGSDRVLPTAQELFTILIGPVEEFVRPGVPLCIVADKALHLIPFGTLVSPATNAYLVESFPIIYSPSATVFVEQTAKARQKTSTRPEAIFAVGNPAFARAEHADLNDLPDAASEAETIASLYNAADLATGENATRKRFFESVREADVIHFAGHYVPSAGFPEASKLLLAAGDLRADEISRAELRNAKLMVLSACSTGIESFYNGEGVFSSARAFLTAGVPLVIASQWPVDSRSTARLMISFHEHRTKGGRRTIDALQRAQVELLRDTNSPYSAPYYWAAFSPIGGFSDY